MKTIPPSISHVLQPGTKGRAKQTGALLFVAAMSLSATQLGRASGAQPDNPGGTANLLRDGRVFVAGGINLSFVGLISIQEFDAARGAWRLFNASLSHGRPAHTTTTLLDGSLIVAGGIDKGGSDAKLVAEAELFVRPR